MAVTQVFLMASPLSTMWKAIKERNSASFHVLYCIMGLVSSTMYPPPPLSPPSGTPHPVPKNRWTGKFYFCANMCCILSPLPFLLNVCPKFAQQRPHITSTTSGAPHSRGANVGLSLTNLVMLPVSQGCLGFDRAINREDFEISRKYFAKLAKDVMCSLKGQPMIR